MVLSLTLVLALGAAPSPAGEAVDLALEEARKLTGFVVLVLDDSDDAGARWTVESLRGQDERLLDGQQIVVLAATQHTAAVRRFAAGAAPQTVLLDGEGRILGRLQGRPLPGIWAREVGSLLHVARQALPALGRAPESLDAEALLWLGKLHWNRGERGQAAACFELLRQTSPGGVGRLDEIRLEAEERLAQHHLDSGRFAEAEAIARGLLAGVSSLERRCQTTLLLALSLKGGGQARQAVALLQAAVRELPLRPTPLHAEILFSLGCLQLELGAREEARRCFESCAKSYPQTLHGQRSLRRCSLLERQP